MLDRRAFVAGIAAVGLAGTGSRSMAETNDGSSAEDQAIRALSAIRASTGGRLGVAALDTGSGRRFGLDAESRYAMCSTFKMTLAAAVLVRAAAGRLTLDTPLPFTDADVLDYAPVVKQHLASHSLTVGEACAGAVEWSDNSAANLLLAQVGGPAGLTRFIRRIGDPITRLDRTEPTLNTVPPGDERDTTTPAAMVGLMRTLLLGPILRPADRERLIGWMVACQTGKTKLRAGLPADWRVGDKTGNNGGGVVNDIAIAWPPGRAPILIACYLDAPSPDDAQASAVHAGVAEVVAKTFG
jgi:beta-lactamase class A